jgi:hypothetical protein
MMHASKFHVIYDNTPSDSCGCCIFGYWDKISKAWIQWGHHLSGIRKKQIDNIGIYHGISHEKSVSWMDCWMKGIRFLKQRVRSWELEFKGLT